MLVNDSVQESLRGAEIRETADLERWPCCCRGSSRSSPRAGVHHLRSLRIVPERVYQLPEVPFREPPLSKPHRIGPLVAGQVVGAKEPVDQREVNGEILIVERGTLGVVPVVVLRGDEL